MKIEVDESVLLAAADTLLRLSLELPNAGICDECEKHANNILDAIGNKRMSALEQTRRLLNSLEQHRAATK